MRMNFERWMGTKGVESFQDLQELILLEQLVRAVPEKLSHSFWTKRQQLSRMQRKC